MAGGPIAELSATQYREMCRYPWAKPGAHSHNRSLRERGIFLIGRKEQLGARREAIDILTERFAVQTVDVGPTGGFAKLAASDVEQRVAFGDRVPPACAVVGL